METILIVSPELYFDNEIALWTQGLIGNEVPGYESYIAEKIIQFQVIERSDKFGDVNYIVFVLIEVSEK